RHLASCSHDRTIKFWAIHDLLDEEVESDSLDPTKRGADEVDTGGSDSDDSCKKAQDPSAEKAKR
ncbi:hypothetical protein L0F63_000593, partial [Massospora cicadina]